MENRSEVVREFFDLIVYLNKANPSANLKTDIVFDIRKSANGVEEFGCYLSGIQNPTFLVLCTKPKSYWRPSVYTKYLRLEDFFCEKLNFHKVESNKTIVLRKIIEELRSLGL